MIAVFREEKKGVEGLDIIKKVTKTNYNLAVDLGAKKTAAYSPGRGQFDSYVVDSSGTIRAVVSGDLRRRAKSDQLMTVVKKINDEASKMMDKGGNTDAKDVEQAVMNYVDAIYSVKPELIEQSVHSDLAKFGFARQASGSEFQPGRVTTYDQLLKLAGEYNKGGKIPANAPKEVKIFEVSEKIAMAKLTAYWGSDFIHLVKQDGKWKILQIVWQSQPATK